MPTHGPPSPIPQPTHKRQRQDSYESASAQNGDASPEQPGDVTHAGAAQGGPPAAAAGANTSAIKAGQSSSFRNVSACNRCRLRKNRCDQRLPSCASCNKAGVACVGYDPITKKEIPRSYVFYLETRIEVLEKLLLSNDIAFPPADSLEICSRPSVDSRVSGTEVALPIQSTPHDRQLPRSESQGMDALKTKKADEQSPAMLNIVSPTKPRSLASASGVSFARVVFAAVQYSVSDHNNGSTDKSSGGTSMRDSFFGLHTKPTIKPAPFPVKDVAIRLVTLYFEHANPQIPILHRGEFMQMFEQAYEMDGQELGARELYMLNMVFAIGCGVIVGEPVKTEASGEGRFSAHQAKGQCQPEEYHASAIVHLEACLSNSGGGLDVLQAVLLLANFALLRPVPPGLWYITGVAVRLAVDLGLHYEDGADVDGGQDPPSNQDNPDSVSGSRDSTAGFDRGRRLWIRDLRRRLWWCTYSFDRLVSTCVGRPFGISDQVITTELPSVLDDDYITPSGFLDPLGGEDPPSYKHVAHHYFRLRTLQSEILQVLQYNQAQIARAQSPASFYPEINQPLPSPYLVQFDSFRSWRLNIDRRLLHWKSTAPTKQETGVAFSTEFLELNYWQAIILLYRQSLSIPAMFEGEYNTSDEVNSPTAFTAELREDEDRIYIKVAEAGQKILRIYRQLHLSGLVSYTYLSTHHLFMAGISYLYAIWHSPIVRSRLTMDEVDFTILAAKSVFTDMIDKCPPAETCRDAFDRTAKATIKMANSSGGFGMPTQQVRRPKRETAGWAPGPDSLNAKPPMTRHRHHPSDQPFPFELSISDNMSSPTLSNAGDISTPLTANHPRSHGLPSPVERAISLDGNSVIDPSLVPSPPLTRSHAAPGGGNAYTNQQFGVQESMDYPDSQTMEFLHTLGASSNGGIGNIDQAQMDIGFGMGWDGMHNDYGEGGQQMNPFDNFFFGGPQGGTNGTGGHSGGGNDEGGGPMSL